MNDKFILEKEFPLSIQLNRMRDLLAQKINSNFNFSVDNNIIQIKEESFFNVKKSVKYNQINLYDKEFVFNDENIEESDKIFPGSKQIKEIEASKKFSLNNSDSNNDTEEKDSELKQKEISDKKQNINITKDSDESYIEKNEEKEYRLFNGTSNLAEIKIYPNFTLNDLIEKYINLIPRRSLFLKENKKMTLQMKIKLLLKI